MCSINPIKIVSVLILVGGLLFFSCTGGQTGRKAPRPVPQPMPADPALEVNATLNDRIESGGDQIDYDTLMQVYQTMIETPYQIAHMDRLLTSLINKRNANPRVDQMILILSAKVLGQSKYPITNRHKISGGRVNTKKAAFTNLGVPRYANVTGDVAVAPDFTAVSDMVSAPDHYI